MGCELAPGACSAIDIIFHSIMWAMVTACFWSFFVKGESP